MSIVGFQEYWPAGSRFHFQRDPISSVEQPYIDLGTVDPANPSLAATLIEVKDSDGGRKTLVDSETVEMTESYDIVCRNFNPQNRAILFLSNPPAAFTQAATEATVQHWATPGYSFKLKDATGALVHGFDAITAVYTTAATLVSVNLVSSGVCIDAAAKTIKVVGDMSAVAGLGNGKVFFVNSSGLANKGNARSYTVVGTPVFSTPNSTITVLEAPVANETGVTGTIKYASAGTIYQQDVDWSVYNLYRGFVQVKSTGAISVAANVNCVFTPTALTGPRLILPLSAQGNVVGNALVYWERGGFKYGTVREFRCSISPSASQIQNDDYSTMTLTVKVLSDLTKTIIAGRMLDYRGTQPATS